MHYKLSTFLSIFNVCGVMIIIELAARNIKIFVLVEQLFIIIYILSKRNLQADF
jgi:hypothetical protein